MNNKKICPPGKILNPKTNRYVLINGKIGKQLMNIKKPKRLSLEDKAKVLMLSNKIQQLIKNKQDTLTIYIKKIDDLSLIANELKDCINCSSNTKFLLHKDNYYVVIAVSVKTNDINQQEYRIAIFNDKTDAEELFKTTHDKSFKDFYKIAKELRLKHKKKVSEKPYMKDAKKIANKLKLLFKDEINGDIIRLSDVDYDFDDDFFTEVINNFDKKAKIIKTGISFAHTIHKAMIHYNDLYIIITYSGIPIKNKTEVKLYSTNDKTDAQKFYDYQYAYYIY